MTEIALKPTEQTEKIIVTMPDMNEAEKEIWDKYEAERSPLNRFLKGKPDHVQASMIKRFETLMKEEVSIMKVPNDKVMPMLYEIYKNALKYQTPISLTGGDWIKYRELRAEPPLNEGEQYNVEDVFRMLHVITDTNETSTNGDIQQWIAIMAMVERTKQNMIVLNYPIQERIAKKVDSESRVLGNGGMTILDAKNKAQA